MNRAEIVTSLKKMIGPGIELDDADLAVWVNDAYMDVVTEIAGIAPNFFTKVQTAQLLSGQQQYDVPEDFEKMLMVNVQQDGVWSRARPIDINALNVLSDTTDPQGYDVATPAYYLYANQIGLLPIPHDSDGYLRIWYVYTPDRMDDDDDEPAFSKRFHHALRYGAYADYLDQNDEHVAAENMRRRFEAMKEKILESAEGGQIDGPRSVDITQTDGIYYDEDYY